MRKFGSLLLVACGACGSAHAQAARDVEVVISYGMTIHYTKPVATTSSQIYENRVVVSTDGRIATRVMADGRQVGSFDRRLGRESAGAGNQGSSVRGSWRVMPGNRIAYAGTQTTNRGAVISFQYNVSIGDGFCSANVAVRFRPNPGRVEIGGETAEFNRIEVGAAACLIRNL